LNEEGHGRYLGDFLAEDKMLVVLKSGVYKLVAPELSTRFDENTLSVEKWIPQKPISCVYFDGEKEQWFVKRFLTEATRASITFISEHPKSHLAVATTIHHPVVFVRYDKRSKAARNKMDEAVNLREFIAVKGLKAIGNKLTGLPVLSIELLEPDARREEESELLLTQMIGGTQPDLFEEEIHQNPEDIEFEIEGLESDIERFRQQVSSDENVPVKQPKKVKKKPGKPPGNQGSLF